MQFVVKFPLEALARVVIFSLQAHIPPLLASSPGPSSPSFPSLVVRLTIPLPYCRLIWELEKQQ